MVANLVPLVAHLRQEALLGTQAGAAVRRLRATLDEPLVSGILRQHITSSREFGDWAKRIGAISSELILDLCRTVVHPDGITAEECAVAAEFLIYRKDRVLEKIRDSSRRMP